MTWAAAERSASRRIEEARQARQWFGSERSGSVPPQSPRRRETAGCSNVRLRTRGECGTEKVRRREAGTSSRANETRVLEIEAADGRNRSHASRVWSMRRRKTSCVTCTLVVGLRGNRLTRPAAKSCDETVSASSSCSTTNSGRRGSWVQARGQSIRWKTSWIEAASSLHRGGVRAVLASRFSPETQSKDGGAGASDEGASSRSDESVVARPPA